MGEGKAWHEGRGLMCGRPTPDNGKGWTVSRAGEDGLRCDTFGAILREMVLCVEEFERAGYRFSHVVSTILSGRALHVFRNEAGDYRTVLIVRQE